MLDSDIVETHCLEEERDYPTISFSKTGRIEIIGKYPQERVEMNPWAAINLRNCLEDRLEEIVPDLKYPGIDYDPLTEEDLEAIAESEKDIEAGNFLTLEELNHKYEIEDLLESILKTAMGHITHEDLISFAELLNFNKEDSKFFFEIVNELHEDAKIAIDASGNYVWIYNPDFVAELNKHPELRIA